MSSVRILPEILSNKIAAGEVVERPASVVKELIENSLDAGSSVINIELEQGGKNLIRISDNGSGMSADDALTAIERYATSKIYNDDDLFSINTLGFRGEALPSIASVSRFTLVTREQSSDIATEVYIEGGKVKKVSEAGAPPGTLISIEQLFYNTPARRKFLKTINTEMGYISDIIASIALGWPEVHFRLTHNKKLVKSWPKTDGSFNRAVDVLGNDLKNSLHEIVFEDSYMKVNGWLSSPDISRTTSNRVYIYINGRFIKDRKLLHALLQGYGHRLMKGRYPVGVVFIDIPFDQLDVNVHPTKHEVRFADHQRVFNSVKSSVADSIAKTEKAKWNVFDRVKTQSEKKEQASDPAESWKFVTETLPIQQTISETQQEFTGPDSTEKHLPEENKKPSTAPELVERFKNNHFSELNHATPAKQKELWEKRFFSDLRIIGQLKNSYILCDSGDGLIIIDQHAAHERILFEKLRQKGLRVESQILLLPETVELGYKEAAALEKLAPELSKMGLDIEPFGGNTFTVRAVPSVLSEGSVAGLVTEIAEKLIETGRTNTLEDVLANCLIIMACHGSIRANQPLVDKQIKHLLHQMDECESPSFCPHGRPTWVRWSIQHLEKSFRR